MCRIGIPQGSTGPSRCCSMRLRLGLRIPAASWSRRWRSFDPTQNCTRLHWRPRCWRPNSVNLQPKPRRQSRSPVRRNLVCAPRSNRRRLGHRCRRPPKQSPREWPIHSGVPDRSVSVHCRQVFQPTACCDCQTCSTLASHCDSPSKRRPSSHIRRPTIVAEASFVSASLQPYSLANWFSRTDRLDRSSHRAHSMKNRQNECEQHPVSHHHEPSFFIVPANRLR